MASKSKLEDLNISQDEMKRIGEALKDENFRKLFCEYAEEISDPENRRRYEEEIAQMERERGMDVTFIRPEPGHVLKTSVDGDKKAFINISKSDKIDTASAERKTNADGKTGLMWHIPHSFAPPREDSDKQKRRCQVYDFVVHPDTYRMAEKNIRFKKLVEDTALDGIEKQFGVTLDRKNIKRPKMQFKGVPSATVIRSRNAVGPQPTPDASGVLKDMPYPYDNKTTQEKMKERELAKNKEKKKQEKTANQKEGSKNDATVPKYTMLHRSEFDMQEYRNAPDAKSSTRPRELVIKIELPLLKSAAQANLDIFEKRLLLESSAPASYRLDLPLPYPVDEANGNAKFDKQKRILAVTLPVVPDKSTNLPTFCNGDIANGNEESSTVSNDRVLVEVLFDSRNEESSVLPQNHDNGSDGSYSRANAGNATETNSDTFSPSVTYSVPEYTFTQDTETISFVLKVKNVAEDSVKKTSTDHEVSIQCTSQGEGGFPLHFSLFLRFSDGCQIAPEHCTVDITAENVVLLLLKERQCRGMWDSFLAGKDSASLEEQLFLTTNNLQRQLLELDAAPDKTEETKPSPDPATANGTDSPSCNLRVTAMDEKKLTIKITQARNFLDKKPKGEEEDDEYDAPSSAEIQVIHTQPSPNLHSILKQRTVSESSEDFNTEPESPRSPPIDDEDELSLSASGKRRSVSFSKHIDKATFKSSASVNSMKTALKSKRKRQRKWEEKKDKAESRRRHNSAGSEGSGDDHSHSHSDSHSYSEEEVPDEDGQGDVSEEPETVLDDRTKQSENKPDVGSGTSLPSSVGSTNPSQNLYSNGACEHQVSSQGGHKSDDNAVTSVNEEEVGDDNLKDKGSEEQTSSTGFENLGDPSITEATSSENSSSEVRPEGSSSQGSHGNEESLATKIKSKLAEEVPEDRPEDSDDEEEATGSDHSSKQRADYNEHRTECAFMFSNEVMFDLDVD